MNPQPELQPQDHPNEPLLEAQLLQTKDIGDETNGLLEALIHQGEVNNVEPVLEASLVQSQKNTDRIVEAIEKQVQTQAEAQTPLTEKLDRFLGDLKGDKGDKGDDGRTPTPEEIKSIIEPLIPDAVPGKDGQTPTPGELVELIKPLIPDPIPGQDGDTPSKAELERIIKPLIPKPVKGDKGDPGKDAKPDEATVKTVLSLKKQLENLSRTQNSSMVTYRANGLLVANGAVLDIVAGDNILLETQTTNDGAIITINANKGVTVSAAAPSNPSLNDLWVDIN